MLTLTQLCYLKTNLNDYPDVADMINARRPYIYADINQRLIKYTQSMLDSRLRISTCICETPHLCSCRRMVYYEQDWQFTIEFNNLFKRIQNANKYVRVITSDKYLDMIDLGEKSTCSTERYNIYVRVCEYLSLHIDLVTDDVISHMKRLCPMYRTCMHIWMYTIGSKGSELIGSLLTWYTNVDYNFNSKEFIINSRNGGERYYVKNLECKRDSIIRFAVDVKYQREDTYRYRARFNQRGYLIDGLDVILD